MTNLTYDQARNIIEDGDIVFLQGSWTNPVQAIIMFFTQSKLCHVCIAFWIHTGDEKRLMCVEAQGGTKRRILNLSFYDDRVFVVVKAPQSWDQVVDIALQKVGKIKYNVIEALYVGIRECFLRCFDISIPIINLPHEICSEFVAKVYNMEETEVSPQLLYENLLLVSEERTLD